jgi:hypothetical protein
VNFSTKIKKLLFIAFLSIGFSSLLTGCATDSGAHFCRSPGDAERSALTREKDYRNIANSHRITHNEDFARYYDVQAQQEHSRSGTDSHFSLDFLFAMFGNCDR